MACLLRVLCRDTSPGDEVALVGADPALGGWNVWKSWSLRTSAQTFPDWEVALPFPVPKGTEYKLVVLKRGGGVVWEGLEGNRSWPLIEEPGSCVTVHFGERGEVVHPPPVLPSPTPKDLPKLLGTPFEPPGTGCQSEDLRAEIALLRQTVEEQQQTIHDLQVAHIKLERKVARLIKALDDSDLQPAPSASSTLGTTSAAAEVGQAVKELRKEPSAPLMPNKLPRQAPLPSAPQPVPRPAGRGTPPAAAASGSFGGHAAASAAASSAASSGCAAAKCGSIPSPAPLPALKKRCADVKGGCASRPCTSRRPSLSPLREGEEEEEDQP